jgi:hypothetical protein
MQEAFGLTSGTIYIHTYIHTYIDKIKLFHKSYCKENEKISHGLAKHVSDKEVVFKIQGTLKFNNEKTT